MCLGMVECDLHGIHMTESYPMFPHAILYFFSFISVNYVFQRLTFEKNFLSVLEGL